MTYLGSGEVGLFMLFWLEILAALIPVKDRTGDWYETVELSNGLVNPLLPEMKYWLGRLCVFYPSGNKHDGEGVAPILSAPSRLCSRFFNPYPHYIAFMPRNAIRNRLFMIYFCGGETGSYSFPLQDPMVKYHFDDVLCRETYCFHGQPFGLFRNELTGEDVCFLRVERTLHVREWPSILSVLTYLRHRFFNPYPHAFMPRNAHPMRVSRLFPPRFVLQNLPLRYRTQRRILSFKPSQSCRNTPKVFCSVNMAADQSDDPKKLSIGHIVDTARSLWDRAPQPVKDFSWNDAFEIFIQLVLDLILAVVKYSSLPLFVVTSISEMSYCTHERKLYLILFPFLMGVAVAVAGTLRKAALEASPFLKRAKVPWHPGPYFPYWGRIFLPHFANGAIWRTIWFIYLWYRKPQRTSEINQPDSMNETPESSQS